MFFIESTSIAVTHLYPKYKGLWKKKLALRNNNNECMKDNINSKVKFKIRSNKMYKAQKMNKNNKPTCTKNTGQISENTMSGLIRRIR